VATLGKCRLDFGILSNFFLQSFLYRLTIHSQQCFSEAIGIVHFIFGNVLYPIQVLALLLCTIPFDHHFLFVYKKYLGICSQVGNFDLAMTL